MTFTRPSYEGIIKAKDLGNFGAEDRLVVWGNTAFVTSSTTVEVYVSVEAVEFIVAFPKDAPTPSTTSQDTLYSDGVVTSEGVTVTRTSAGTSALPFWFLYIGRPASSFLPYD